VPVQLGAKNRRQASSHQNEIQRARRELRSKPGEGNDSTKALVDEGLLVPVQWMNVARVGYDLQDEFARSIHSQKSLRRFLGNSADRYPQPIQTMRMPDRILEALRAFGLGVESSDDWWAVRPDIASASMSTLAWGVAAMNPRGCDLLTDRAHTLDRFRVQGNVTRLQRVLSVEKAREVLEALLNDLFLVPDRLRALMTRRHGQAGGSESSPRADYF